MKKFLLGATAAIFLAAPAMAADLPVKAAPPVVAPVAKWTGCYVGGSAGYTRGRSRTITDNTVFPPNFNNRLLTNDPTLEGAIIGGQGGCDYQFNSFVVGVSVDGSTTDKNGSERLIAPFNPFYAVDTKENWLATAQVRLGYTVIPSWLLYVTGGGAWAGVRQSEYSVLNPNAFQATNTTTETMSGWVVGVGTEYMWDSHWSIKGEVLWVDLGTHTFLNPGFLLANAAPVNTRLTEFVARIGVNFRFNLLPAAVVARY
jgi:outer membrane immunogenic protein